MDSDEKTFKVHENKYYSKVISDSFEITKTVELNFQFTRPTENVLMLIQTIYSKFNLYTSIKTFSLW